MPDARTVQLARAAQRRLELIGGRAGARTGQAFDQLSSYNEADVATFAQATAPTLAAAKSAGVVTGVGLYATLARLRSPRVTARDVLLDPNPREPFISYWNALKHGHSPADALQSGRSRAMALARNLVISAARRAGDVTMQRAGRRVEAWERVPDAGACEWCESVANDLYRTAESADFGHDRCNCTAVPQL